MTTILGISAYYHDSAAALVRDGVIVAATQEERFSRCKHDKAFPTRAVSWCLDAAEVTAEQLDYVAFYEKPWTKFERILDTFLAQAPEGFAAFHQAMPTWLKDRLYLRRRINQALGRPASKPIVFLEHHESHAASAFLPSPFETAAILTLDGVGEWTTTSMGVGTGNTLRLTHQLCFPHSLGLLYSACTAYCGFQVNDGEYKLMGLAPYGQPVYRDTILRHLIDVKADGSFRLNLDYFTFGIRDRMTNRHFDRLFGGPARSPDAPFGQRHLDLAASIQLVTEEVILHLAEGLHHRSGEANLVLAGGVALNSVANGRLLREGPFRHLWIQPAAGDAGGALGAALFVWYQLLGRPRGVDSPDAQQGSFLGPEYPADSVTAWLTERHIPFHRLTCERQRMQRVAAELDAGKVVGWFCGRMEYGPRALGARSILADARCSGMQSRLNRSIKFREGFRPFAPAVLVEHAHNWFDLPAGQDSPYMLMVVPVKPQHCLPEAIAANADIYQRARGVRSTIPAVTHVDHSARVQTVDRQRQPSFHALLTAFHERTGCPVLINTSFNVRDEPIVCSPADAYRCFQNTGIDLLVLGDCLITNKTTEFEDVPDAVV